MNEIGAGSDCHFLHKVSEQSLKISAYNQPALAQNTRIQYNDARESAEIRLFSIIKMICSNFYELVSLRHPLVAIEKLYVQYIHWFCAEWAFTVAFAMALHIIAKILLDLRDCFR